MDQDATQVRILRPSSRDENNVRTKLTDHGTIEVLFKRDHNLEWLEFEGLWYNYLKVKYLISEVQN